MLAQRERIELFGVKEENYQADGQRDQHHIDLIPERVLRMSKQEAQHFQRVLSRRVKNETEQRGQHRPDRNAREQQGLNFDHTSPFRQCEH